MKREEFEANLKSIFNWKEICDPSEILCCLLLNDEEKLKEFRTKISASQSNINDYLSKWDSASSQEEKMKIAGSITK